MLYVLSLPNFILFSDDFSSYYNNFLYFLDSNYKNGFNEYNYEFLFPSLNLVLSKFIYGKFPYLMKLGHIIINLLLLFITIIYVSKKEKIKINDFLLFTCCIMIFYKLPQQMHLMRQGYACYFIIMALFSNKICSKLIFIIIGSFFHLSTPIIYLIINALSKINNKKKLIAYTLLFASTFLLFYYLSKQKIFFHFPLLNKLNYIINYI
ncbi:TPA: EpsG family protein, partial [Proteus mirabilis]